MNSIVILFMVEYHSKGCISVKKACMALLCLLLAGCQRIGQADAGEKEPEAAVTKTYVCTQDADKVEFKAEGDKVISMKQTLTLSLTDLGISEDMDKERTLDAVKAQLDEDYGKIDGVETSGTLDGDTFALTVTIDYEKADTDQLIKAGLLEKGEMSSQYVSLEKSEKELAEQGFACKAG